MSNSQKITMYLRSYDSASLARAVNSIVETASRSGANVSGPIPFPKRVRKFTVLRSPHVNKEARDQFEIASHCRFIILEIPEQSSVIEALKGLDLGSDVDVQIKVG
ncbi:MULTISPECIES: 30S ribosomal protein S10 [Holospora]|uniref:Small ribosomal subunit protein uS10 n=2 Tax=Holospora TaxID=44747 RepID=A0A061JHE5_9PROT|nr:MULTISPECIES: 30S ribosomal protein S10 [Holospora]ETZ04752.1 30S ribosomal protein S10 [Holospora undulata HU1]GAJ46016.1 30S ribosomal protein S10 [Holospora elegans E1]